MKNLKVKKNGRGGIILSVSLDGKEARYLGALLNYAPTRIGDYLSNNATPENKTINLIRDALAEKDVNTSILEIDEAVKRYIKSFKL
jgi:hypothetical protein